MENKSKKRASITIAILLIANVSNMLRSETLSTIRTVDAIQLIACGMLAGALIANLVIRHRS